MFKMYELPKDEVESERRYIEFKDMYEKVLYERYGGFMSSLNRRG